MAVFRRRQDGWQDYNESHFGKDRWPGLLHALQSDYDHVCFLNPFLPADLAEAVSIEYNLKPTGIPGAFLFEMPEAPSKIHYIRENDDGRSVFLKAVEPQACGQKREGADVARAPFFFADGASIIVALALGATEGDVVLDMFAGCGTGALVLASSMYAAGMAAHRPVRGRLVCNEVSKARAAQLQDTMSLFLPMHLFQDNLGHSPHIVFTSACPRTTSNSMEKQGLYDRILIDAPCTDDRQLLRGVGGSLDTWSAATHKVSMERQVKFLYNALWLLKEDGIVLFCSRSLSPEEGDAVVEAIVKKARGCFELEILPLEGRVLSMVPGLAVEATPWGSTILPDKTGYGPLFFARLRLLKRTHPCLDN